MIYLSIFAIIWSKKPFFLIIRSIFHYFWLLFEVKKTIYSSIFSIIWSKKLHLIHFFNYLS